MADVRVSRTRIARIARIIYIEHGWIGLDGWFLRTRIIEAARAETHACMMSLPSLDDNG